MSQLTDRDLVPWYRQFWPWFIIALPAAVVVAGLSTVYIAFKNADTTVSDQYYRDGLAINQIMVKDQVAAQREVTAQLVWDDVTGEVLLNLNTRAGYPRQLKLVLLHPTDQGKDRHITLSAIADRHYRAALDTFPKYRYYLWLLPLPDEEWRLRGEIDFAHTKQVVLRHQ